MTVPLTSVPTTVTLYCGEGQQSGRVWPSRCQGTCAVQIGGGGEAETARLTHTARPPLARRQAHRSAGFQPREHAHHSAAVELEFRAAGAGGLLQRERVLRQAQQARCTVHCSWQLRSAALQVHRAPHSPRSMPRQQSRTRTNAFDGLGSAVAVPLKGPVALAEARRRSGGVVTVSLLGKSCSVPLASMQISVTL